MAKSLYLISPLVILLCASGAAGARIRQSMSLLETDNDEDIAASAGVPSSFMERLNDRELLEKATRSLGLDLSVLDEDFPIVPGSLLDLASAGKGQTASNSTGPAPAPANDKHRDLADPTKSSSGSPFLGGKGQPTEADLIGTAGDVFSQLGGIIGKLMTRGSVGVGDWINLATATITAGINIGLKFAVEALKLVSTVAAGFVGLLGGLIAAIIQAIFALFMPDAPSTGELIAQALARERMRKNTQFWASLSDEFGALANLFSGDDPNRLTWYLIVQHDLSVYKSEVFNAACLAPKLWDTDECKKYIKDGMWEVMIPYAQLHLTTLWEITMLVMENPQRSLSYKKGQVELLIKRAKQHGKEYHAALQHAWEVWYPHRMGWIWDPFNREDYGTGGMTLNECGNAQDGLWKVGCAHTYHPFDFLHVERWAGYDSLQDEFPLDWSFKGSWRVWDDQFNRDVIGIMRWGYGKCAEKPKEGSPCQLIGHITKPINKTHPKDGGCGCSVGRRHGNYSDHLNKRDRLCWANCMKQYRQDVSNETTKAFKNKVDEIKKYVDRLDCEPVWKYELQRDGSGCEADTVVQSQYCEEGLKVVGESHTSISRIKDDTFPAGCFFQVSERKLVINDGANRGTGREGFRPICGALFFARE